jgi:outer membrane protein assembly factor BamD (BamD/ComL family)
MKRHRVAAQFVAAALCIAATAAATLACGWPMTTRTVRFNGHYDYRDFERLPPLAKVWRDPDAPTLDPADYEEDQSDWLVERRANVEAIWKRASDGLFRDDFAETRRLLKSYLDETAILRESGFVLDGAEERQKRRNTAIDVLDALTAADGGSPVANVRVYLNARVVYDLVEAKDNSYVDELQGLDTDPNLRDNARYLLAAIEYKGQNYERAERGFADLVGRFPKSEKRDAALLMAALSALKQSAVARWTAARGDFPYSSYDATPVERDAAWERARDRFARLLTSARFASEAKGWLAFLSLSVGDRVDALARYYRMLADADVNARLNAATSLTLARSGASEADMAAVQHALADEPAAALAYAYHELYNLPTLSTVVPDLDDAGSLYSDSYYVRYDDEGQQERERRERREAARRRVATFAERLAARYPGRVGAGFALRVAMAKLELGEHDAASRLAGKALVSGLKGEHRIEALWVQGVADYRQGRLAAARKALETALAEDSNGRLAEGARRLLAMVCEDLGDLSGALDMYVALDYRKDIAYFVDVLMAPGQLAEYIESRASRMDSRLRDELNYSLGVRYLRDGRFELARAAYARVRPYQSWEYVDERAGHVNPKDPEQIDGNYPGIRASWLARDRKTMDDLERLQAAVDRAGGDEEKAEALYQVASYVYQGGTLLFYNPAIWRGMRHYDITDLDNGRYRSPGEQDLVWRYERAHETPARALDLYMEVAEKYPNTRAARDALYTAAVCHDRLAGYFDYWRSRYGAGLYAGTRRVTYDDVKRTYPGYALPEGTYGWEPMTRTVNGGPARREAPPPPPRPPKWRRALDLGMWGWRAALPCATTAAWWIVGLARTILRLAVQSLAFGWMLVAWNRASHEWRLVVAEIRRYDRPLCALLPERCGAAAGVPTVRVAERVKDRLFDGLCGPDRSEELRDALVVRLQQAFVYFYFTPEGFRTVVSVLTHTVPALMLLGVAWRLFDLVAAL